jgi:hypothetical protein
MNSPDFGEGLLNRCGNRWSNDMVRDNDRGTVVT